MSSDFEILKEIWCAAAGRSGKATAFMQDAMLYVVCGTCVWCSKPGPDEAVPVTEDGHCTWAPEASVLKITDTNRCKPEVSLQGCAVPVPKNWDIAPPVWLVPVPGAAEVWCVRQENRSTPLQLLDVAPCDRSFTEAVKSQLYQLPDYVFSVLLKHAATQEQFNPRFDVARMSGLMALRLYAGDAMQYMTLCTVDKAVNIDLLSAVTAGSDVYKFTSWDENRNAFKKLIKKGKKMAKLEISQAVDETPAAAVAAAAVSPAVAPAEEPKQQVEQALPKTDEQSPEPEEQASRKRTRKVPTKTSFQFDGVMSYLSAPPDPAWLDQNIEDAVQEIRILRDLQIAAARRSANIALGLQSGAADAVAKLKEVLKVLK